MWSARFQSHMNHVSVSPTDGNDGNDLVAQSVERQRSNSKVVMFIYFVYKILNWMLLPSQIEFVYVMLSHLKGASSLDFFHFFGQNCSMVTLHATSTYVPFYILPRIEEEWYWFNIQWQEELSNNIDRIRSNVHAGPIENIIVQWHIYIYIYIYIVQ